MDWEVCLLTKNNQIKTVIVYDYNYMSDASEAALAQTGGKQVLWCSGYNPPPPWQREQEPEEPTYYNSTPSSYGEIKFDYDTKEGLLAGYLFATFVPSVILAFINPILTIIFNILFARWWFSK